jgi:hypothetical protein
MATYCKWLVHIRPFCVFSLVVPKWHLSCSLPACHQTCSLDLGPADLFDPCVTSHASEAAFPLGANPNVRRCSCSLANIFSFVVASLLLQPWFGLRHFSTLTGAPSGPLRKRCSPLPRQHLTFTMPSIKTEHERESSSSTSKRHHGGRSSSCLSSMSSMSDANIRNFAPVARIMKTALPDNAKIAKEAKECMQECVSEFISFITSEGMWPCVPARQACVIDVAQRPKSVSKRNARRSTGKTFSSP